MIYSFSLLRHRMARVRYGAILLAFVLTLGWRQMARFLPIAGYGWEATILLFPLVGFCVELFRSTDLLLEDETAHLLPITEHQLILGVALSLTLSFLLLFLVEGMIFLLLFVFPLGGIGFLFPLPSAWGVKAIAIFGSILMQGVFGISLLLFLQLWRRRIWQRRFYKKSCPKGVRIAWDAFFLLFGWALFYLIAQWLMVRFPYMMDLSYLAIQRVPATPEMVGNAFAWILTPPLFPSVFTQWNVAPLLLEMTFSVLFLTLASSIAEESLDW